MFGLSKREQRWKAEQEAAEAIAELAKVAIRARADVAVAEANSTALTEERVRQIIREELAHASSEKARRDAGLGP